ncbi:MAG TPA: SRPBCC family protein [Mycobacteriales bacterium]|nr:SRPBCC family protein [Mycobacteriales bacterium]
MSDETGVVSVSRRIEAPAEQIFALLADPGRHTELDGSQMLRGAAGSKPVTGVGDRFVMNMFFDGMGGDYAMDNHVVEFEPNRRIAWTPSAADDRVTRNAGGEIGVPAGHKWSFDLEPDGPGATVVTETYDCTAADDALRQAVQQGEIWRGAITGTLERLEQVCTGVST